MAIFTRNRLGLVLGMSILASAGCQVAYDVRDFILGGEPNPAFCQHHPEDSECTHPDAGDFCERSDQCMAPNAVCDVDGTHMCVQCTPSMDLACTGATPVCVNNQCQPCSEHAQCMASSDVCLPGGTCADPGQVAYVDPMGTDPSVVDSLSCSLMSPCKTVMKALLTNRMYLKLRGNITDTILNVIDNQNVTFLAEPGAQLTSKINGTLLDVKGTSQVAIYDLELTGASGGSSGNGILLEAGALELRRTKVTNNSGVGISAIGGNALTISQSILNKNVDGGISVTGTGTMFDIENNFITYNGDSSGSANGGVVITSNTNESKFERNTIAFNGSTGNSSRGGVSCKAPLVSAVGNLIFNNTEVGMTTVNTQYDGSCQFGNTLAVPTDAGNLGFKSPLLAPFDFHLTSASPRTIIDAGGLCTGIDFDGDVRPIGAACDLGADEYHP